MAISSVVALGGMYEFSRAAFKIYGKRSLYDAQIEKTNEVLKAARAAISGLKTAWYEWDGEFRRADFMLNPEAYFER
jgi:hypothetical protein